MTDQAALHHVEDTRLRVTFSQSVENTCLRFASVMLLFLLSVPFHLLAQKDNLKFERIQVVQGVRLGDILSLLQDSQGFMWFGTGDGLYKYDGYGLTPFKRDRLDSTSLGNNLIFSLYEDRSGTLWIGTAGGGLNRFDREKEEFTRFVRNPNDTHSLNSNVVRSIYEDSASPNTLWVGTWNGLNKLDRNTGQFTRFLYDPETKNPGGPSNDGVLAIMEDRFGTFWVPTTGGGLNKLDRETGHLTRFVHDSGNPHSLSSNTTWSIHEDRSGTLWIGTAKGLNRFDREHEQFIQFVHDPKNPRSLSNNRVLSIHEDRTGTLWIGTGSGLNILDPNTGQFIRLFHDPTNPHSLSSNSIWSILEDRSGTLWIGTSDGVNRLDHGQQRFAHFAHDPGNPHSLSHKSVGAIHEDRSGTLWVGTAGGLNKLDRDTGQFRHFVHDPKNTHSLSHNNVTSIHEDRTGALWVGTSGGLNRFDRDTGQFTRFVYDPRNPHSLSANNVWSILEDRTGTLWIGTEPGGLNRFDREQESFTHFIHDPVNSRSLGNNVVTSIHEGRAGILWLGTGGGGINQYDRERKQFIRFVHDRDNPRSLSHDWVGVVFEDRAGTLWSATWYGGLNKLDNDTKLFTLYTEKNGLPTNHICSIAEDEHGRLWLGTLNGLSHFDPQSETFRNFDVDDGLKNNWFNWNACIKSRSGELFFGGDNGIDYFHPDSVRDNPHIPPVVITRFTRYNSGDAEGKPIIEKGISEKHHLDLSYDDRILTIEFAALNFRNAHKNQYAYKLEGFNEGWIQLGSKHEVTFTNIDPGEYTLRVKGSNNDGVWNEDGASLRITIVPPWWRTRWAYGLYVLLLTAALYGLRHYELRRLQLRSALRIKNVEAEKLQEVDRLKSRFFASISHEFRTPLTLILGPIQKWLSEMQQSEMKADLRMVQRNARRLQQLIDQLLDLSKLEAGKMRLQARPEKIGELIRMITMTFESVAKQKGIDLQFQAPEEDIVAYVERDKLEKIVSNLLSNAFKFTPKGGRISVQLSVSSNELVESQLTTLTTDRCLLITVKDTGVGIPQDQLDKVFDHFHQADNSATQGGTGIGLALTKELVGLHHGKIAVESEVGKGTTFIVELPLGKEHLTAEEIAETVSSDQFSVIDEQSPEPGIQHPPTREQSHRSRDLDHYHSGQPTTNTQFPMVLIVEDHPDMRAYMRGCLEERYRVIETEDGTQGVKQAHKHAPDLIISDVMMPEMDGFELCEKVKTDARTSHIPVILLTARASADSKVEGLETGADDYLTKPFEVKELQVRIKNLIEQRRSLRERFRRELVIEPAEVTVTSTDEAFLKKVMAAVEAHIDDPDFETDDLARESAIGRRQLNRKLRALTGQSVREFIRTIRLKRAAYLLQQQSGTVTEIAYQVGFNSIGHFAKVFREQFGVAPSEYFSG